METLITAYSPWFIPLCLTAGIGYAAILYYRETKNEFSVSLRWGLAILRTLVVSGIAFLLLNPLVRSEKKHSEKPVILILHDNSESVATGRDSLFYSITWPDLVSRFIEEVGEDFDLQTYLFGDDLSDGRFAIDYSAQETNIGNAFDAVYQRYSHKNVGAMVLMSDGINNRGSNPLYSDPDFHFPVYTVALGDTSLQRDLVISRIHFNRLAYLDNMFPVEINVVGKKSNGQQAQVTVERNNEVLYRTSFTFRSGNEFRTLLTSLQAKETGLQKYTVRISGVEGEITYSNNAVDFYIDVLEDKQKILLLADAPHPDVSAIKQTVAGNINYSLEDFLISDFTGSVKGYNLVILHGLPSEKNNSTAILKELDEEHIPTFFILTKKTHLPLFNQMKTGLTVNPDNLLYNEALPMASSEFNLFGLSDEIKGALNLFPPLISPYGNIELLPSVTPLLFQQIGSVPTRQPLWTFNQSVERKTAVLLGPGIWKWRIREYSSTASHEGFNDLLNKTIQYLALRVDKSFFRVYTKPNYTENEDIEIEAELYNEVYELVNKEEVSIALTGSDGTVYPFSFTQTSNAYYLNAGNLPADSYSYSASVVSGGETQTEKGEFTVSDSKLEKQKTEADHNLLFNLANKYGGEMVYPDELDELAQKIRARDDIRTITYSQKRFSEILNIPYLLGLILLLLSLEWFMRKRAGGY